MFRLKAKLAALRTAGGPNPFVGDGECGACAERASQTYREVLARQGATP